MENSTYIIIAGSAFLILSIFLAIFIRRRLKSGIELTKDEILLLSKQKFGRFEIKSFICRGNLSTTYEAIDTEEEKTVALRIFKQELLLNSAAVKQFKLKSQTLKYFSDHYPSKRLVSGVETGEEIFESELRPYISADLIDGTTLTEVLNKYGKLSPADSFNIIQQLSQVISLYHQQKVFLHEISPENVVLHTDTKGKLHVVLADIGIAYKDVPIDEIKTNKQGYYAKEEENEGVVNERTDVYAFAALLFKMLTGKNVSRKSIEETDSLNKTIRKALSEDIENRPESIVEFIVGLDELSKTEQTVKDRNWIAVIDKLATKKINKKNIKRKNRKKFQYKKKQKRGFKYFVKYMLSIIALGLAKLWEWLLTPKHILIALIIIVVILGIWAYYSFTTISGDIVINVKELSARIPYKKIDSIEIQIEVKDKISNALLPLELSSIDETNEPEDSKILLKTNKDGIAVAHYSGRVDRDDVLIAYHIIPRDTKYDGEYIAKTVYDTTLNSGMHDKTILLRPIVSDQMPVYASIKGLPLARGDKPPETFKIDVYLTDGQNKPIDNASLYLKTDIDSKDSTVLQYRGGSFVLTNVPLKDDPYYLRYIVDDSTKMTMSLIIEPEGSSKFKFENDGEPAMISKGGSKPEPAEPVIALDEEIALRYKFIIMNESGDVMKGVRFFIQASDVASDADREILVSSPSGEILYPEKPIQVLDRFWQSTVPAEADGEEADSIIHYKIWLKIPGEPFPRNESRNSLKWTKPADPSKTTYRIELNQQTMQISFFK